MGFGGFLKKASGVGAIAGALGLFKKNKQSVNQEGFLTDAQKSAQADLLKFGQTGTLNGLTAGASFSGSLGEFEEDPLTSRAKELTASRLGGTNAGLETSSSVLSDLATDKFDEDSPLFRSFTKSVQRAQSEGSDILDRESAITGDRFSTSIGKEKGLLAERGQDALAQFQAELFNRFIDIRKGSAESLSRVAALQEDVATGRISQAQAAGELSRQIKDDKAKANLNEFLRQRSEKFSQIDALKSVFTRSVQFGVKDLSSESASPFTKLLGSVIQSGATAFGASVGGPAGAAAGNKIGSIFNNGLTSSQSSLSSIQNRSTGGTSRFRNTRIAGQQPSFLS